MIILKNQLTNESRTNGQYFAQMFNDSKKIREDDLIMSNFNMDWGSIKEPGQGRNVDFLKLQPGENKVRIAGKPSMISVHWEKTTDGSTRKVICPGSGCPLCAEGQAPSKRYQVKVIDRVDGEVKILESGPMIFNQVKAYAMDPDYGDPTKYDIKIRRDGTGRDTRYTLMPAPRKSELNEDEKQRIQDSDTIEEINEAPNPDEIRQMGLQALSKGSAPQQDDDAFSGNEDEITDDDWDQL
jgi:hypothetical protein